MCERTCCCSSQGWDRLFYHQYLHQHASMTRWIQYLDSYSSGSHQVAGQAESNFLNYSQKPRADDFTAPVENLDLSEFLAYQHQYRDREENESPDEKYSSEESDCSSTSSDDYSSSDYGSCTVSTKSSERASGKTEEDFELLDSIPEVFEYVQLDKFGNMPESRKGRKSIPHTAKEQMKEKETKLYLYGGKATTIGGLETAINLDYNRQCDLYQPHLWPVLALKL